VVDVQRDGFLKTMDRVLLVIHAHGASGGAADEKAAGSSFTMTYYGSQMVVQNYNVMALQRALEAAVRYIAAELGPKGIRVHAISPGPLATRAASGIPEFDELMDKAQAKAPPGVS